MGRPKLSEDELKSKEVSVYLNEREKERLDFIADYCQVSRARAIRFLIDRFYYDIMRDMEENGDIDA